MNDKIVEFTDILKRKAKQIDLTEPFCGNQKVTVAQAIGAMREYLQLYSAGEVKVDPDKVIKIPPQMIKEGCDTPEPRKITLSLPTDEEAKIRYDLAVEHWHSLTKNKLKGKDESERQGEIVATFIECLKIAAGL